MSLEDVTADASLERNEYHKLSLDQLEKLDDAEALYQRADRMMWGIKTERNLKHGLTVIIEAARRGHAVALGVCFLEGQGVKMRKRLGAELLRGSAERGHASGSRDVIQFSPISQLNSCWQNIISTAMALI
jgi:hypothetical protein